MQRYFIYLAYDGTNYHGWQIQPNGSSVQECLMKALSTFLRRDVEVIGAGRTDAGVHASLMVAHFDHEDVLDTVTVEGFRKVIEQQDRCKAGTSAPGNALFLVNVEYPEDIFSEETKKSVLSTLLPEGGEC